MDEQSILGTQRTKSNRSAADPISLYSSPKFPRQSPALIALQGASLDHEDKRKHLSFFFGERRFIGRVSSTEEVVLVLEEEPEVEVIQIKKTPDKAQLGPYTITFPSDLLTPISQTSHNKALVFIRNGRDESREI